MVPEPLPLVAVLVAVFLPSIVLFGRTLPGLVRLVKEFPEAPVVVLCFAVGMWIFLILILLPTIGVLVFNCLLTLQQVCALHLALDDLIGDNDFMVGLGFLGFVICASMCMKCSEGKLIYINWVKNFAMNFGVLFYMTAYIYHFENGAAYLAGDLLPLTNVQLVAVTYSMVMLIELLNLIYYDLRVGYLEDTVLDQFILMIANSHAQFLIDASQIVLDAYILILTNSHTGFSAVVVFVVKITVAFLTSSLADPLYERCAKKDE